MLAEPVQGPPSVLVAKRRLQQSEGHVIPANMLKGQGGFCFAQRGDFGDVKEIPVHLVIAGEIAGAGQT